MERKAYPSDLTDEQWSLIEPFFPPVLRWGRPRTHSYREIVNAIFYYVKTGCQWRHLPHDLPPWGTVESYFSIWKRNGLWKRVHDALVRQARTEAGRDPDPSAGVIDSQSVKTTGAAPSEASAEKRGGRGKRPVTTPGSRSRAGSATSSSTPRG
jgi:putative transposase